MLLHLVCFYELQHIVFNIWRLYMVTYLGISPYKIFKHFNSTIPQSRHFNKNDYLWANIVAENLYEHFVLFIYIAL